MLFSGLQAIFLTALLLLALGVRAHLLAENLFLRHQIQLLQTRGRKARRPEARTRLIMAIPSRLLGRHEGRARRLHREYSLATA